MPSEESVLRNAVGIMPSSTEPNAGSAVVLPAESGATSKEQEQQVSGGAKMPAAPQPPVAPAVIAAVLTAAMKTVETSKIETPAAVPMEEIADAAMEIAAEGAVVMEIPQKFKQALDKEKSPETSPEMPPSQGRSRSVPSAGARVDASGVTPPPIDRYSADDVRSILASHWDFVEAYAEHVRHSKSPARAKSVPRVSAGQIGSIAEHPLVAAAATPAADLPTSSMPSAGPASAEESGSMEQALAPETPETSMDQEDPIVQKTAGEAGNPNEDTATSLEKTNKKRRRTVVKPAASSKSSIVLGKSGGKTKIKSKPKKSETKAGTKKSSSEAKTVPQPPEPVQEAVDEFAQEVAVQVQSATPSAGPAGPAPAAGTADAVPGPAPAALDDTLVGLEDCVAKGKSPGAHPKVAAAAVDDAAQGEAVEPADVPMQEASDQPLTEARTQDSAAQHANPGAEARPLQENSSATFSQADPVAKPEELELAAELNQAHAHEAPAPEQKQPASEQAESVQAGQSGTTVPVAAGAGVDEVLKSSSTMNGSLINASLLSPVFFQALETVQRAQLDPSAVDPAVQASLDDLQEIFARADLDVQEVVQAAQLQAAADEVMDGSHEGATTHPERQGAMQDGEDDAMERDTYMKIRSKITK
jgi:hypothetical protein